MPQLEQNEMNNRYNIVSADKIAHNQTYAKKDKEQTQLDLEEAIDITESAVLDLERTLNVPNALTHLFQDVCCSEERYEIFDSIQNLRQLAAEKAKLYNKKNTAYLLEAISSMCTIAKEILKENPKYSLLAASFEIGTKVASSSYNVHADKGLDSYTNEMQMQQQLMQKQNEMDQDFHQRLTTLMDKLHKSITDMFQAFEAVARGR